MRTAIVHYWFLSPGGGERVIEALGEIYPDADIFVLFAEPDDIPPVLRSHKIVASILNRSKTARRFNRQLFALYPLAIESLDLRDYDLVISSDSPPMKGVRTRRDQMHVCYCHTPGRYIWDNHHSFRKRLPWVTRPIFSLLATYLRRWDWRAAQRVNAFIANSNYVAKRIKLFYGRDSAVIYPPVRTAPGYISESHDDYYLYVGRLVENKRVDLIIDACKRLQRRLVIVGTGREESALRAMTGPTIEFLGHVADEDLPELYARCRALLFASDEDFGIVPLEAQSYGRPVIAYGAGGSLETVRGYGQCAEPTGLYFDEQTVESVCDAIAEFESIEEAFNPVAIRDFARTFDTAVFIERMKQFIDDTLIDGRAGASRKSSVAKSLSSFVSASRRESDQYR